MALAASTRNPSITALEAFNATLCADTGAGRGAQTTPEASARYYVELAARATECRALIDAVRLTGIRSHYVDGIAGALARAVADHGEPAVPSLHPVPADLAAYRSDGADARAHGYDLGRNSYVWTLDRGAEPAGHVAKRKAWDAGWIGGTEPVVTYQREGLELARYTDGAARYVIAYAWSAPIMAGQYLVTVRTECGGWVGGEGPARGRGSVEMHLDAMALGLSRYMAEA